MVTERDLSRLARDLPLAAGDPLAPFLARLALRCYLKTGHVTDRIAALLAADQATPGGLKFNPNHDERGRFTFGTGVPAKPDDNNNSNSGTQVVQEIPPILEDIPNLNEPTVSTPRASPNFQPPTNPPQMPPGNIPSGWRVREMPATPQYPNGYWRLEKPLDNGG